MKKNLISVFIKSGILIFFLVSISQSLFAQDTSDSLERKLSAKLYKEAVADYNEGIRRFKVYIEYRNNQFKPVKPDMEIYGMIDSACLKMEDSWIKLNKINHPDPGISYSKERLHILIDHAQSEMNMQLFWLIKYLRKGNFGRKMMFKEYTWLDVPLDS